MTPKIAKMLASADSCDGFARNASTDIGRETFKQLAVLWRMLALHELSAVVGGNKGPRRKSVDRSVGDPASATDEMPDNAGLLGDVAGTDRRQISHAELLFHASHWPSHAPFDQPPAENIPLLPRMPQLAQLSFEAR